MNNIPASIKAIIVGRLKNCPPEVNTVKNLLVTMNYFSSPLKEFEYFKVPKMVVTDCRWSFKGD